VDRSSINTATVLSAWSLSKHLLTVQRALNTYIDSPLRISAREINESFEHWLDQSGGSFFAMLNLYDAHEPYLTPDGFGFPFAGANPLARWDPNTAKFHTAAQLRDLRDTYDSTILYLDDQFGRLLAALEKRGLLQNTIVILTADHGETIGEHYPELIGHHNSVYYDVLNVPLVVYAPSGVGAGVRSSAAVSIADVPRTVMNLVDAGGEHPFPGTDLVEAALARGSDAQGMASRPLLSRGLPAEWHLKLTMWPMAFGPLFSLVQDRWHYIVDRRQREQLFDLSADPWERDDLHETAGADSLLEHFRAELKRQGITNP
jgi:arylsulfatase A-like enzyme